ncbi:hypothetical protein BX666DRAFT_2024637 [Dichotomocladium elegans]|nr:hypothetical protein BX666DRAFT_2024637 [Dichotomocladium elegans]
MHELITPKLPKIHRYTRNQRARETRVVRFRQIRDIVKDRYDDENTIREAEARLAQISHSSVNAARYKLYVEVRGREGPLLSNFYSSTTTTHTSQDDGESDLGPAKSVKRMTRRSGGRMKNRTVASRLCQSVLSVDKTLPLRRHPVTPRAGATATCQYHYLYYEQQEWLLPCAHTLRRRLFSTKANQKRNDDSHHSDLVLSIALEQSNASTARALIEIMFHSLRRTSYNPSRAWECYHDLSKRHMLHYLSRDQYRDLFRFFTHSVSHSVALNSFITLAKDARRLGYYLGRKEKLLLMRLLGMNGRLDDMEAVYNDLKEDKVLIVDHDTLKPFNIMMTMYQMQRAHIGNEQAARKSMEIYDQMITLGVIPSSASTRLLIENIRSWGTSDESVERVWEWFWEKIGLQVGGKVVELEPSLYREMTMYFTSAGRPEYALEINDMMVKKGIPRDVRMMTALIHKVGRSGNLTRSLALLDEMIYDEKLLPNSVTFNALIDIHAHHKPEPDLQGASRMYELFHEYNIKPDITTLGPLVDMFAKKGDLDMVRRLYHDMVHNLKLVPNAHIYSSLIECFVNYNDFNSALEILRIMKNNETSDGIPNKVTYNLLIHSYVKKKDLGRAFRLIELMTQADIPPDSQTFTPILGLFADDGDTNSVRAVIDMMKEMDIDIHIAAHTALLEAYAKSGDLEGAEKQFRDLQPFRRPNVYTFNALLYVYAKCNEMDLVLDIYKRMTKLLIKMNEYTYGILINYFARRKEMKAVESLLQSMIKNHVQPDMASWTSIMRGYFSNGQPDEALRVVDRMAKYKLQPNFVMLSVLIEGSIDADDLEMAESVLQKALESLNSLPSDPRQLIADANAAESSADLYTTKLPVTVEDLLNIERSLPARIPPPHLFNSLIKTYANREQFDQAKNLIRQMVDIGVTINDKVYVTLMHMYRKEGKHDIVWRLWDGLRRRSETPIDLSELDPEMSDISISPPPAQLKSIERLYLALQKTDIPNKLAERLFDSYIPHGNPPVPTFAVSVYMDSLASQGRVHDIEALWMELEKDGYPFDEQNWNRYITALAESGDSEKALRVAKTYLSTDSNPQKHIRAWDDAEGQEKRNHLHIRTFTALANSLDLVTDGVSNSQLQAKVYERLGVLDPSYSDSN